MQSKNITIEILLYIYRVFLKWSKSVDDRRSAVIQKKLVDIVYRLIVYRMN
jgi:hypothetical protein